MGSISFLIRRMKKHSFQSRKIQKSVLHIEKHGVKIYKMFIPMSNGKVIYVALTTY